ASDDAKGSTGPSAASSSPAASASGSATASGKPSPSGDGSGGKAPGDGSRDEGGSGGKDGAGTSGGGSGDSGGSGGSSGGSDDGAPAPACASIGGGKVNCEVWRAATSYDSGHRAVGTLNQGTNYFFCQVKLAHRETYGKWTNVWWAKTDDDSGNANVYVSAVYLKGGQNDQPVPGLPVC
ncbi:serine/threonine protein kinase, partial [Streptomyces sp. SID5785]|nr:serine/threonine protein kinase [Streptomyces sp. SID5785]